MPLATMCKLAELQASRKETQEATNLAAFLHQRSRTDLMVVARTPCGTVLRTPNLRGTEGVMGGYLDPIPHSCCYKATEDSAQVQRTRPWMLSTERDSVGGEVLDQKVRVVADWASNHQYLACPISQIGDEPRRRRRRRRRMPLLPKGRSSGPISAGGPTGRKRWSCAP